MTSWIINEIFHKIAYLRLKWIWEIFITILDAARPELWSNLEPSPPATSLNLTRNLKIRLLLATKRWLHLQMISEFTVFTLWISSDFVQASYKPNKYGQYFEWYGASNFERNIFQKLRFVLKWEHYRRLWSYKNSKKSLVAFLREVQKGTILASFDYFSKQISRMKVHFKKMAL